MKVILANFTINNKKSKNLKKALTFLKFFDRINFVAQGMCETTENAVVLE